MKLDAGSHVNGFIGDMAISINFGDSLYNTYVEAAEAALETAITNIKDGVKISLIGELVEKKIKEFDLRPISNLSGHQVKQYNLHAGKSIPSVKSNESGNFVKDEVYAIEPFVTNINAAGRVKNDKNAYIYQLIKRPKNLIKFLAKPTDYIQKKFRKLPFCERWLPEKYQKTHHISRLTSMGIIHAFPVLVEAKNGIVAQAEKTIAVTSDGCEILTK